MHREMKPHEYIREAELRQLLSYFSKLPPKRNGPQKYLIVYLAKSLGLRLTEATHLRVEDFVDLDQRIVVIRAAKKKQKKPGVMNRPLYRQRVAQDVVSTAQEYFKWAKLDPRKHRGWLFPSPQNKGDPISLKLAHNWFVNGIKDCGLPHKTFHSLRRYRGFLVQRSTGDLTATMRELRHESPGVTTFYTRLTPDEEMEQLDAIEKQGRARTKASVLPSPKTGFGGFNAGRAGR